MAEEAKTKKTEDHEKMTDAHSLIGKILEAPVEKDAIHVALASVQAGERLFPGQHVGFGKIGDITTVFAKPTSFIGIIDPYLEHSIDKGQWCFLFLYPKTVTSLKHVWEHPAFGPVDDKTFSERWLEDFASSHGLSYERIMEVAEDRIKHGEYLCEGGRYEGDYTPKIFWEHYEKVTGTKIEDKGINFFTCSCN